MILPFSHMVRFLEYSAPGSPRILMVPQDHAKIPPSQQRKRSATGHCLTQVSYKAPPAPQPVLSGDQMAPYQKSQPFYVIIDFSACSNPDQRHEHGALFRPLNNLWSVQTGIHHLTWLSYFTCYTNSSFVNNIFKRIFFLNPCIILMTV